MSTSRKRRASILCARIEAGATIDPLALIGPRAEIGAGTLIDKSYRGVRFWNFR